MGTTFADIVRAWRDADPAKIHPMREHVSEQAYWESGEGQAQFVGDLVQFPALKSVLDFGCGDGRVAIPLAQLGFDVYAVDAAPEMIERLEHRAAVVGVQGIQTLVNDGMGFSNGDVGVFDVINARAVFIHHSHADVESMVRNLAGVLKTGGWFVADWPLGRHHERRDWIDVTTWDESHRMKVATLAGLEFVSEGDPANSVPSVWRKL